VPSNAIDITTRDGIVTLTGSVDNLLAKDRAQAIAEATVGVRAVINRIQVQPPADRSDGDIARAVEQALFSDPATDSYEVDVQVTNGMVKLTGSVQSWQEKQLCTSVAKGIKGAVDITNDISSNYESKPDYEIRAEVKERLANDVRVDDALIRVKVDDNKAILTGTVGSLQEKTLARSLAWIVGVNDVDTDNLKVKWWTRDKMQRKTLYVSRSDKEIKEAVEAAFLYDPRVYSFEIDAEVDGAVVTLSGVVDNLKAKQSAEQDATNTMGVIRVKNNVKVRPVTLSTNTDLKRAVSKALIEDLYVDRFELTVSAFNGTVYLSGDVNTSWEKQRAKTVTQGVKGVLSVANYIDSKYTWTWKPDWQIRDDIEDEFFWSPFVDGDDVNVSVENGIATLTGAVGTYSERQSAEDNAFEGGAKDVLNKLSIQYHNYGPYYYGPYGPYGHNFGS